MKKERKEEERRPESLLAFLEEMILQLGQEGQEELAEEGWKVRNVRRGHCRGTSLSLGHLLGKDCVRSFLGVLDMEATGITKS